MKNLFNLGLYVTFMLLFSFGNVFSAFSSQKERSKNDESEFTVQLHVVNDITFPFKKTSVSDNGRYIAGSALGEGAIHNTETNQTVIFSREGMDGDYIADVTNEGMVVGRAGIAASSQPAYRMLDGDWVHLPNNTKNGGSAAASSSDGSVLGGHILDEDSDDLYRPALWVLNGADYELVVLPMPEEDVQGNAPRGVKVVDISADGSVILGLFEYDFDELDMIYPLVWTKEGDDYTYTELGKSIPEGVLAGGGSLKFFLEDGLSLSGDGRYVTLGYTYLDMEVYVMTMFQHIAVFDLNTGSDTFTVLVDPNEGIAPYWFLGDYSGDLWFAKTLNDGTTLASKLGNSPSTQTQGLVYDTEASEYIEYEEWVLEQSGMDILAEAELSVSGYPFASSDGSIFGGAYTETGTDELKFYYIVKKPRPIEYNTHVIDDITFPFDKTSVSDNGRYIAGSALGEGAIHNTETNQTVTFSREGMDGDYIADVTNEGMVVGRAGAATSSQPAYRMLDGDWVLLPNNTKNGGSAAASSSDGSVLGGHILDEDSDNLYRPALWVLNGTDYELVVLPMPEEDVQGNAPRGVKVVDISADGSVILGLFEYDFNELDMIYPLVWTKEGDDYTYTELGKSIPEGVLAGGGGVKFFLEDGLSLSGDGRYVTLGYTYLDMEVYVMTMFQHIAVFDLNTGSDTFTVLVDPNEGIAPYWFLGDYTGDLWFAKTLNDGTTLASKLGNSPSTQTQGLVYDVEASEYIEYEEWIVEQTGVDILTDANLTVSGYPFASSDGKIIGGAYTETESGELKFYYIRRDFVPDAHVITASVVGNGIITPAGDVEVEHGSDQTFTFSADAGYELTKVMVDGVNVPEAVSAGSYTFVNVVEAHTIVAEFEILVYTISASAVGNGTITPSGEVEVEHGSDQAFTFSADAGYELTKVMVDGVNVPEAVSAGSYTFTNVVEAHAIVAEFEILVYTISASAVGNGTITPSGEVEVEHGSAQAFTFSADAGYELTKVMVDGVNVPEAVSAGSYTFVNVIAAHTIVAEFEVVTYTITASSSEGGTINPEGEIAVEHGESITFTFTADSDYELDMVLVDGENIPEAVSEGTYTFSNVAANHEIEARFIFTTGVNADMLNQISVYPNPAADFINISNEKHLIQIVLITDLSGRLIKRFDSVNSNSLEVDISYLSQGIYIINIDGVAKKVVKN